VGGGADVCGGGEGVGDGDETGGGETGDGDGVGAEDETGGEYEPEPDDDGCVLLTLPPDDPLLTRLVLWTAVPATEDDAPMPPVGLEEAVVDTLGGGETGRGFRAAFTTGLAAL
jgi:hypothetical protein